MSLSVRKIGHHSQYQRGEGQDSLIETGGTDRMEFKNIAYDQLWFNKASSGTGKDKDLIITVIGTTDKITIKDWYMDTSKQVEQFSASNGTLSNINVQSLVQVMATLSIPAAGKITLTTAYHAKLDVVLGASWNYERK